MPQVHPKTFYPAPEKLDRNYGHGSPKGQRMSPHMQENNDLFEAGEDPAVKVEPVIALNICD